MTEPNLEPEAVGEVAMDVEETTVARVAKKKTSSDRILYPSSTARLLYETQ